LLTRGAGLKKVMLISGFLHQSLKGLVIVIIVNDYQVLDVGHLCKKAVNSNFSCLEAFSVTGGVATIAVAAGYISSPPKDSLIITLSVPQRYK
jgi:hypothetical protein